jgi:hypothetical protein
MIRVQGSGIQAGIKGIQEEAGIKGINAGIKRDPKQEGKLQHCSVRHNGRFRFSISRFNSLKDRIEIHDRPPAKVEIYNHIDRI